MILRLNYEKIWTNCNKEKCIINKIENICKNQPRDDRDRDLMDGESFEASGEWIIKVNSCCGRVRKTRPEGRTGLPE
jgi:hypothetical protein